MKPLFLKLDSAWTSLLDHAPWLGVIKSICWDRLLVPLWRRPIAVAYFAIMLMLSGLGVIWSGLTWKAATALGKPSDGEALLVSVTTYVCAIAVLSAIDALMDPDPRAEADGLVLVALAVAAIVLPLWKPIYEVALLHKPALNGNFELIDTIRWLWPSWVVWWLVNAGHERFKSGGRGAGTYSKRAMQNLENP